MSHEYIVKDSFYKDRMLDRTFNSLTASFVEEDGAEP
jgi:hypothetical protein